MRRTVTPPRNRGLFPCPNPNPPPTPRPLEARTPRLPVTPVTGRRLGCCPLPVWLSAVSGLRGRPCMRLAACGGWPRVGSLLRLSGLRWLVGVGAVEVCWVVAGWGVAWRAGCRGLGAAGWVAGRGLVRGRWRRVLVVPVLVGFPPRRRAGAAVRGRLRLRRCGAGARRRPAWSSGGVTAGQAGRGAVRRLPVRLVAAAGVGWRMGGYTAGLPVAGSPFPLAVVPVTVVAVTVGLVRSPVSDGVLTALPRPVATG